MESLIENEAPAEITEEQLAALRDGLEKPFDTKGVVKAFASLTLQLKESLGRYDTVLSDDSSARIVTRVLDDLINQKRREEKEKFAPTYFLAGGRETSNTEEIKKFLQEKGDLGKTLLVTEYISTGVSLVRLTDILKDLGIDFDVAALSVRPGTENDLPGSLQEIRENGQLYVGEVGKSGLSGFYDEEKMAGVIKDRGQTSPHPRAVRPDMRDQEAVKRVRQDAAILADRLYSLLNENKDSQD